MGKYEVTNPEEKIQIVELIPTHKLNVTHTIYKENGGKYLITRSNVNGSKDYEIDDNIISEIGFVSEKEEGVSNADLLEIVFDRLNGKQNASSYEFEALRAVKTALVFLSAQETDDIVAYASQMAQQQAEKKSKDKEKAEEKTVEGDDDFE